MRVFNFIGVLIVAGAGFFLYQRQAADEAVGDPIAAIDTTAVRQRLMTIAKSEWQFHAEHARYATLDELESSDQFSGGRVQRGYEFTATASATSFRITATPFDADKADWPTLEITETMRVTER